MKKFSSYRDITNKYDSALDRWVLYPVVPNLKPKPKPPRLPSKLTLGGQRLEKMMIRSVGKRVVESVWKGLRKTVKKKGDLLWARAASDRFGTFKQAIRLGFKQRYIAGNPCELAEITPPNFDEEKI